MAMKIEAIEWILKKNLESAGGNFEKFKISPMYDVMLRSMAEVEVYTTLNIASKQLTGVQILEHLAKIENGNT